MKKTILQKSKTRNFWRSILMLSVFLLSNTLWAQFSQLRITVNSANNLHLQEVEWMVGTTANPTVDLTSNVQDGYTVSSAKAGTGAFRAYDGTADKIYIGNNVPYEVTLEVPSAISPTSVRIQKPSWSGLTDFLCEGYDGSAWVELAHVQNPANWADFAEFPLTLPQDTQNPTVTLTSPVNGSTFTEGDDITINVTASDNVGVEFVRFWNYESGQPWNQMAQDFTAPYSHTWTNVPAGNYLLHVRAEDAAGNSADDEISVTINPATPACSATGTILMERWDGISGTAVSNLTSNTNYPDNPSSSAQLTQFKIPTNVADNYGVRVRGFLCAPQTGDYTFWVTGDDNVQLWLSTDDNPANVQQIAYHTAWSGETEWNKYSTQKSAPITLTQGNSYYIEAFMKEQGGGDNLSVGWLKPGESGTVPSEVIPGSVLSPAEGVPPVPTYNLNVTASNGTVTPASGTFDEGTVVSITATPDAGYQFDNWSGDASGSNNPLSVTMDADKNITANFSLITVDLPNPWQNQDIGSVAAAGNATYSDGVFTIDGSGSDIWNNADEFHFVYQPLTGDGEIVAQVTSQTNTNGWAKAGVMIRESLANNSVHAMTVLTPSNGVSFQRRTTTGGTSTSNTTAGITVPGWVKIERTGDSFNAYRSTDGANWTQIGSSQTIAMNSDVYVGLAVTSHNDGTLSTATFDNVTVSSGPTPVTYTLTTATSGSGTVNPAGTNVYDENTVVTVTATPDAGYQFDGWNGDLTGSSNPVDVTMDADKTITANFSLIPSQTNLIVNGDFSGSLSPWQFLEQGQTASATVVNNEVLIDITTSGAVYQPQLVQSGLVIQEGASYTVEFDAKADVTRTIEVNVNSGPSNYTNLWSATPSLTTSYQTFSYTFTASFSDPDARMDFNFGGGNTDNVYIDNVKLLTDNAVPTYTLTTSGVNGLVSPQSGTFVEGEIVSLSPVAYPGYIFDSWSGDASGNSVPLNLLMDADKNIIANFIFDPNQDTTTQPMALGTNFWNFGWGNGRADYYKSGIDWSTAYTSGVNPWRQEFLDDISIYSVIRFMDQVPTNNSTVTNWSERVLPTADHYSTSSGAVAYEWQIDLCNRIGADIWITVPHLTIEDYEADPGNNYWTQLAQMIRDNLDPSLNVYVEYSNETWSACPSFCQGQYTGDRGVAMGFDPDWGTAKFYFHVYAATRLHDVFLNTFGTQQSRIKTVVSGQANNFWGTQQVVLAVQNQTWNNGTMNILNPFGRIPDYFSVANYNSTADGAVSDIRQQWSNKLQENIAKWLTHKAEAATVGMKFIAYEGGQHYTTNANIFSQNPESYDMYLEWLNAVDSIFDITMHYTHVGRWSSGGAWGAKDNTDQSLADAHRYRALADFVNAQDGTDTQAPSIPSGLSTSDISQTSVDLNWNAATDNVGVTEYDVFKNNVLETTVTGTSVTISGLTASTSYNFKVRAKDAAGNVSGFSSAINVTTNDPVIVTDSKVPSINLHWVRDYLPPIFADAFITVRDWEGPTSGSGAISLDADGWPNEDCGVVVWHGYQHRSGTYRLIFEGQADVTWEWASGVSIQNQSYNSSTNTTTADLVFSSAQSAFRIKFTNTNGGVKNIKMMRPIAEGSSTYHDPSEIVDREMKAILSKFEVVRYMDPSNINSNPETTWSDRRLPGKQINKSLYNPYAFGDKSTGVAWEYIIAISNETNTSPWICIPAMVDNDYVTKVAQMFRYGSNGVNPYTTTQSNPTWEPLSSNLELYVEYSNEVWNSGTAFRQHHYNLDAAKTEVANNLSHPLNFDGIVASTADVESKGYDLAKRRVAWKTAEISKIFRNVFGSSQMMSRIRPLFLWQISGNGLNSWGLSGLSFTDAYYQLAESHTTNYYFWGGGPAGYYSPADDADINTVWNSNYMDPVPWADTKIDYDGRLNAAFGLKFVLYEGGPGFGDALGGSGSTPVGEEAWNDPRIYNEMDEHHTAYNQKGGELFCYYVLHHDFRWTFLHEGTSDDNTYKMQYMEDMQLENRAACNVGYPIPVTLNGGQFDACKTGWWLGNSGQQNPNGSRVIYGSSQEWLSYRLLSSTSSTYYVTIDYRTSGTSQLEIHAGGNLLATINLPNTGGAIQSTSSYSFAIPENKLYAVRVRAAGGANITIEKVDITTSAKSGKAVAQESLADNSTTGISIFPNPVTDGFVTIALPHVDNLSTTIKLFDLSGKVLKSIQTNDPINQIELSGFEKGIYLVEVSDQKSSKISKLVIR